jgi:hypothetical protein
MEKSRAIELLKLAVPIKALTQQEYADFVEAINMAIDALEQPTSPDTISRQAAIDAIHCNIVVTGRENAELVAKTMGEFVDRIKALPTVQLVATDTNVGDTISRQSALKALRKCQTYLYDARDPELKIELSSAEAAINNLPTVQPEKAKLSKENTSF